MTISVIVAAYQQATPLGWLLDCLSQQQIDDSFEVLVCDDGSGPEILNVVADAGRRCGFDMRYIWQPDAGFRLSRSRNNGIRCATGDVVVLLDADQLLERDFLALHAAAHSSPKRLVAGPVKRVPLPESVRAPSAMLSYVRGWDGPTAFPAAQHRWATSAHPWMSCIGANLSFPRRPEVAFDERFVGWGGEDRELSFRLSMLHGYAVVYEPRAVSYNLSPTGSDALRGDDDMVAKFLQNRVHFRALYPDADLSPAFDLVRRCFHDARTDRWYIDDEREQSADDVLAQMREWLQTRVTG
jgi:glycosyltransferase involved in cell wall biosynthesis